MRFKDLVLAERQKGLSELIETWMDQQKIHRWEGNRGVRDFEKLVLELGYDSRFGSTIENFLVDNPGAVDGLVEWIGNQRVPEWVEKMTEATSQYPDEGKKN